MFDQNSHSSVTQTLVELNELVNNLLLLLSEKEKTVIKKRFNLDGKGRYTLERIGKDFVVTRERIRQIEKNALNKMKRNVFNTTLKNLHEFISETLRENGGVLKRDSLFKELTKCIPSSKRIDNDKLILSLTLNQEIECIGNTINFHPHIKEKGISDNALKEVSENLVNDLSKHGDVKTIGKLQLDLKKTLEKHNVESITLKSLVDIDKRLTITNDDNVGLLEWRHIHPRTLRDKILFILRNENKPLHFVHIAEKITKAQFDNRDVNIQAVHNELIRHPQFVLIGRGIYALGEWGYESGTVAEVIEKILDGIKDLSEEDIIHRVLERRQVKKITIILALKNNPKFSRVGRKRYKLK